MNIPVHAELLREHASQVDMSHSDRQYPSLIAELAQFWPRPSSERGAIATLDEALERASRPALEVRTLVAALSLLLVPATYWLAREFLSVGSSLFATALVATSLLVLDFSTQARPHAVSTTFVTLAIVAALRYQANRRWRELAVLALCAALAVGTLHSAWALVFPLAFVCWFERDGVRRPLDRRVWVLVVVLAAALLYFYRAILFGSRDSDWGEPQFANGTLRFADHRVSIASFNGRGFASLFRTLENFEPLLGALVALAIVVWLIDRARGRAREVSFGALGAVLSLVLPELLLTGLFAFSYERFFAVLVPPAAVFAAWGASRATTRVGRGWRVAASCALALPIATCVRWSVLRTKPDTLAQVAERVVELEREHPTPIFVDGNLDLPLLRASDCLAADAKRTRNELRPWLSFQARELAAQPIGPRYEMRDLAAPSISSYRDLAAHPERILRALGPGLFVIRIPDEALDAPEEHFRSDLIREGECIARIGPSGDHVADDRALDVQLGPPGDERVLWLREFRASALGPIVEIYRYPR